MRAMILALTAAVAACTPAPAPPTPAAQIEPAAPLTPAEALARMPSWDGARAAGVDFRGIGQEPGWIIDIYTQDRITLTWDYGERTADFPLPQASSPQEGATRYDTALNGQTLAVTIRRAPCQDTMSDESYPSTVEVVIDGRTLNGCGKSV